ncbi:MAG: SDR family oxidoreductase, partial [Lachnospira sp.]|nr:SDR family oxidoreductase [Lachnospira sp.]
QLEAWKEYQPEAYEKNIHGIPMGRFGDSETDIGRVCVQLASPDFKYMSGETLTLQGGSGQRP